MLLNLHIVWFNASLSANHSWYFFWIKGYTC